MRKYSSLPTIADYRDLPRFPNRQTGGKRADEPPAARRPDVVSVITVSFNAVTTIGKTIDSVEKQTYPGVEYIVIDGGSTDGTVELLRQRTAQIDVWISEPDKGISDAFNKGIALASGEYIAIVNSDDWLEPDHLRIAVGELQRSKADFVFGDMMLHTRNGTRVNLFLGEPTYASRIGHYMPYLNHPTVVCVATAFDRVGLFDTSLRTAMDYDWLLRLHRAGGKGSYQRELLGHMSLEGESDRNFIWAMREMRDVSIRHGYPATWAWLRYGFRLMKGQSRRKIQRLLPTGLYQQLRKMINANYRGFEEEK
jgi:glycosyltransferase involved in cell wall biosynthesis